MRREDTLVQNRTDAQKQATVPLNDVQQASATGRTVQISQQAAAEMIGVSRTTVAFIYLAFAELNFTRFYSPTA